MIYLRLYYTQTHKHTRARTHAHTFSLIGIRNILRNVLRTLQVHRGLWKGTPVAVKMFIPPPAGRR